MRTHGVGRPGPSLTRRIPVSHGAQARFVFLSDTLSTLLWSAADQTWRGNNVSPRRVWICSVNVCNWVFPKDCISSRCKWTYVSSSMH